MTNYTITIGTLPAGVASITVDATTFNGQGLGTVLISLIDSNNYESTPQNIIMSATDLPSQPKNLTSVGRASIAMGDSFNGTAWRLSSDVGGAANLKAYGTNFSYDYVLPPNSQTYVISPYTTGAATHILTHEGISRAKAAGSNHFTGNTLFSTDNYTLIGTSVGDSFTAAEGNDLIKTFAGADNLLGNGGNDTLIGGLDDDNLEGGAGADRFVFDVNDPDFFDSIADFTTSEEDVLAIQTSVFDITPAPAEFTTTVADFPSNPNATIFVDTDVHIQTVTSSDIYFAFVQYIFDPEIPEANVGSLIYNPDGDWSDIAIPFGEVGANYSILAISGFANPTAANFDFF